MTLFRKNLLWEGSRMFLPEHREQLETMRNKQSDFTLPEFTEDHWREVDQLIQESLHSEHPLLIHYVREKQQQCFCGFVQKVNVFERWLILANGQEQRKILFQQLYEVKKL